MSVTAAGRPHAGHEPNAAPLAGRRIVLDCRWLGLGGAGRLTELLLAELRERPPEAEWVLWGRPDLVEPVRFAGAAVAPSAGDPRALFGQRDLLRVPRGDVVVYMHQIRPLRPGPSVTFILDTIPLRHGGGAVARLAKRAFFHAAASLSRRVVTISAFSKASIERDLGVPTDAVLVAPIPVDEARARAVARLRERLPTEDVVLYVGRFDRHKNIERLCRAFAKTRFSERGGRLLLVGGWPGETEGMREWVARSGVPGVDVRPRCSEAELDELMASSRALVVPSLEEGYGLPAFEAAASGLPVAASRTGAMSELSRDQAVLFDPLDVDDMAAAIDEATAREARPPAGVRREPRLRDVVLDAVARSLDAR